MANSAVKTGRAASRRCWWWCLDGGEEGGGGVTWPRREWQSINQPVTSHSTTTTTTWPTERQIEWRERPQGRHWTGVDWRTVVCSSFTLGHWRGATPCHPKVDLIVFDAEAEYYLRYLRVISIILHRTTFPMGEQLQLYSFVCHSKCVLNIERSLPLMAVNRFKSSLVRATAALLRSI